MLSVYEYFYPIDKERRKIYEIIIMYKNKKRQKHAYTFLRDTPAFSFLSYYFGRMPFYSHAVTL